MSRNSQDPPEPAAAETEAIAPPDLASTGSTTTPESPVARGGLESLPPTDLVLALRAEIRDLAQSLLRGERPGHTLQPTAMLGELWVRLAKSPELRFESKEQFIAYAAASIRHILVDHARRRLTKHRGGGWKRVELESITGAAGRRPLSGPAEPADRWAEAMLELGEELDLLRETELRAARVFELRYFGGMTVDQAAAVLGVSERTVRKDWITASAWLRSRLESRGGVAEPSIAPPAPPPAAVMVPPPCSPPESPRGAAEQRPKRDGSRR